MNATEPTPYTTAPAACYNDGWTNSQRTTKIKRRQLTPSYFYN